MKRMTDIQAKSLVSKLDELCPELPIDDAETYRLLANGDTDGIYMMESDWDKYDLRQIRPQNMEELVAVVALCRCPRANPYIYTYIKRAALDPYTYPTFPVFPEIDAVLKETRGMIIYKEQAGVIEEHLSSLTVQDREKYRLMIHILCSEIKEKREILIRRDFCERRAMLCYKLAYFKVHFSNSFWSPTTQPTLPG